MSAVVQLGTAYETLADENCRTIYDATLRSRQTPTQPPQPASRAHQRSHDHDWQARREDTSYWSGPTFTHGAPDRNEWGKQWDQEQKDGFDMHEGRHRERTAHREARKQAERKKRDMNQPPPTQDSFDQDAKIFKARAEKLRQREEARQREQWLAELLILLSKIMSIEVDIDEIEAKVDETKRPTKGEKEDEDHEQIFHLPIKRKSLERHLQERVDEYKLIVKLLRDQGLEQEANEADVKLREVCTFESDPFRFDTST